MTIRVGINGFGRIGRSVFRILSDRDDIDVVAINDLFEPEQLAYLLKYDTVMGIFEKNVAADGDTLRVGDAEIGRQLAGIQELSVAMGQHAQEAPQLRAGNPKAELGDVALQIGLDQCLMPEQSCLVVWGQKCFRIASAPPMQIRI